MKSYPALEWRTCDYGDKFLVKGTALAYAFYLNSRFKIVETRAYRRDQEGPCTIYRVHDAALVSDADMRAGKGSPVVATFDTPNEAIDFCDERNAA